jgi:hypothetical protein
VLHRRAESGGKWFKEKYELMAVCPVDRRATMISVPIEIWMLFACRQVAIDATDPTYTPSSANMRANEKMS